MAYRRSNRLVCALLAATVLGGSALVALSPEAALALTVESGASSSSATLDEDAAAPPAAPRPEKPATRPPFDPIAARVRYLHERLRITPAQEPLWAKVTQVMRENGKAVAPILRERVQRAQHGTATDYLNAYEKLGEAQLNGLKKFVAAFEALYADLSPAQKKVADSIFRLGPMSIVGAIPEPPEAVAAPVLYEYPPYAAVPPPGYVYYPPLYPCYPYRPWFWGPPIVFGVSPFFFHRRHFFEHRRDFAFDHFHQFGEFHRFHTFNNFRRFHTPAVRGFSESSEGLHRR